MTDNTISDNTEYIDDNGLITGSIDLGLAFPRYQQFDTFGTRQDDAGNPTVKPAMDSVNDTLSLLVQFANRTAAILEPEAVGMSDTGSEQPSADETTATPATVDLRSLVAMLNAAYQPIRKKEQS